MVMIQTRGRSVEIPSNVYEFNPGQYERFCEIAIAFAAGNVNERRARELLMARLLDMREAAYDLLLPEFRDELAAQLRLLDGFFVNGEPDFSATANLLPAYGGYTGPGDWLDGLKFGSFVECLTLMSGNNWESCQQVARILYNIPAGDEVPLLLAFHAPRLLAAVWSAIMAGPIDINGNLVDFRIIFKHVGTSRPDDKTGWAGVVFEVASTGVFGTVSQVEETEMWSVLLYLYKCKFEYINEQNKAPKP